MPNQIPSDPRKRTKSHARAEVQIWFDIPDSVLKRMKYSDAMDMIRTNLIDFDVDPVKKSINEIFGEEVVVDITVRVSK